MQENISFSQIDNTKNVGKTLTLSPNQDTLQFAVAARELPSKTPSAKQIKEKRKDSSLFELAENDCTNATSEIERSD